MSTCPANLTGYARSYTSTHSLAAYRSARCSSAAHRLDYLASKTHAIMIPAAGFDSVPSDIAVYLGNKALKERGGADAAIDSSVSGLRLKAAIGGGSFQTIINALSGVPHSALVAGHADWALSTGMCSTFSLIRTYELVYASCEEAVETRARSSPQYERFR